MWYLKEKSAYILFIFLFLAIFIARPQFVYSQIEFDTDPPYIVETFPETGQTGVPVTSSIEVLFSEFCLSAPLCHVCSPNLFPRRLPMPILSGIGSTG